jgi:uncharacterized membrane protein
MLKFILLMKSIKKSRKIFFISAALSFSLSSCILIFFFSSCAQEPGENQQQTQQTQQQTSSQQQSYQNQSQQQQSQQDQSQNQAQQQNQQQTAQSPTYNKDVKPILDSRCVGCHSQLSSYNGVVNGVGTGSCSGRNYVVKGNPDSSLIYLKITNPPCGSKMPQGGSLSQGEIDTIKNWILGGAPEN